MSIPSPSVAERQSPDSTASARPRLDYLDGLRGLAALYVVTHHAYMEMAYRGDGGALSPLGMHLTNWLSFGQVAVDIFIVLSGYCLMLPVARTTDGSLRGGVRQFFLRRARRILPPYYAALGLTLLLIALVPGIHHAVSARWPGPGPEFTPRILISHLFLLHNLSRYWAYVIDYPMWSVATEWQIYFLFPALLLPIWRRWGNAAVIAVSLGAGLAIHHFLPRFDQACFWFLGLFAFGMAGAALNFSDRYSRTWAARPKLYSWLSIMFFLIYCCFTEFWGPRYWDYNWVLDILIGLSTLCLLVYCTGFLTTRPRNIRPPLILRLLQSRVAVEIGVFSYSLYLIHAPILALVHWAVAPVHLAPGRLLAALIFLGVSASLVVAYLFHRLFERPFMPGHPRTEKQAAQAAVVSPAP